jgi:hypothetical protein
MNKKRMLVIGIALVLMALVAGMVFAGEHSGVLYEHTSDGWTVFVNGNDYRVTVFLEGGGAFRLDPGASRRVQGILTIINVRKVR